MAAKQEQTVVHLELHIRMGKVYLIRLSHLESAVLQQAWVARKTAVL
jgi:hypothetical protein